ncbi:serine protease inhibitor Kazal-type 8 isoform X2 [Heterocephalus glaber]|uniref:Serine protease inhibitor Kazal-type 8 isoform X2 n=1 Tax=Heterocephalus glaber TaxID=10181 RepID=A0AAX6SUT6_HETGA|nr:serine protease inhibitor Kazal-type 8 isoform X2 [Heterocephalus glaber]
MRATFSCAVLVLGVGTWTAAARDFPLPVASTGSLLEDTKAECARNIKRCWFLSFLKPSEPICASDQGTYSGECHLCSRVLKLPGPRVKNPRTHGPGKKRTWAQLRED